MSTKKHIPIILLIFLLLCEIFIPSYKLNFTLQFLSLFFIITSKNITIEKNFLKLISPLVFIFIIGFLGSLFYHFSISNFIKDVTYFLKPILALSIAYFYVRILNNNPLFIKTIVFIGLFTALIHVLGIFLLGNFFSTSINQIRGDFGVDNFIEIFAFYMLFFNLKLIEKPIFKINLMRIFSLIILFSSIYFYFSRTMLVVFILIGLTLFGYTKITRKTLKFLSFFIILISLFYIYLFSIKLERNSKGLEAFFYKVKIAPEEIFISKINRESHKDLWDHWRAYEAKQAFKLMEEKPSSFIFGTGYGSMVNLRFKAPLGDNGMKYISRLHNGYIFIFYKTGIVGLLLLLLFLINIYLKMYTFSMNQSTLMVKRFIGAIGLFYLFTSLIITGIYIPKDAVIFILGGLLAIKEKSSNISNYV